VQYALVGAAGEHTLQPYRIAFDAEAGYADDPISHPGEEFVYVALGNVLLHLNGAAHPSPGRSRPIRQQPAARVLECVCS
jgi:hypothetical protein